MAKQHQIAQLQEELAREVGRDAPHIAAGVFGDNASHPDMAQVSNERLDDYYRNLYRTDNRTKLQEEARRDPEQFLKVAQRIGVQKAPPAPPPPPPMAALPPPPLTGVPPTPPVSPPTTAGVMPFVQQPPTQGAAPIAGAPVAAGPPLLLGPNGQPLIGG